MKRAARIGVVVAGCLALLGLAVWLNLPSSLTLLVQAIGQQRHPVAFDMQFASAPSGRPAQIELRYVPRTPILGITAHYWSIIAPLHIDNVTRTERVQPQEGHVRFVAPMGLVGLSGYRLQSVGIHLTPTDPDNETRVELGQTNDPRIEPVKSRLPIALVDKGTYTFDGPLALWGRTGAQDDTTGVVFSPRAFDPTRQVIWDGLRAVNAHIDLTHYPLPTFQAPVGWEGLGWKADGINLARPGAKLSDRRLETKRGARFALPFSGNCTAAPRFAVVTLAGAPAWSRIDGLWRPVALDTWDRLVRSSMQRALDPRTARPPRSLDDVVPLEIAAIASGSYRLFATCGNPHYRSVAVTWLDAVVR